MKRKNTTNTVKPVVTGEQVFHPSNLKDNDSKNHFLKSSIPNPTMTEQFAVPPPHIWRNIEKILDEQDQAKAANVAVGYAPAKPAKKQGLFITTFGLSVVLCLFFYFS
ncbi:hypothetical protein [Aridibaculum aurantiacum]|uniref:hypothetical protein n=1 Tax=Aridibaculum aurantiacum TaxID=2810307 RepID=UPI001A956B23|nr:hypothetical protein [Aridibaculum aurantiacum]